MSHRRAFVVVSGLPAGGKSTLARSLAPRLRLPVIDDGATLTALVGEVDALL